MGASPHTIQMENCIMSTDLDVKLDEKIKKKIKEPSRWKVIFVNDDKTPMDFVTQVLTTIFKHTYEVAEQITLEVHNQGSGLAGIYSFEIAEARSTEAATLARNNGFPLQIRIEEE